MRQSAVSTGASMSSVTFFVQVATRQTEAELLAECPTCGALTYTPLAYAWQARMVLCDECETKMPLDEEVFRQLGAQAAEAATEIERLLTMPRGAPDEG
jgi:hypothetical protein